MFERYTEQARRAIFFARLEAVHQRAKSISTAHLLAGLDWEENSRADGIGSLKENAVKLRSLTGIPHRPSTNTPYMSQADIPLDREGKMALAYAAEEADEDRQYWIDTDHLLRALLRFRNKTSVALKSIQLELKSARAASERHRETVPPMPAPSVRGTGDPAGKKAVVTGKGIVVAVIAGVIIVMLLFIFGRWIF